MWSSFPSSRPPVIFERLPRNTAADLIAVIFPRYYNLGYVCGAAMLIAGLYPIYLDPSFIEGWMSWALALLGTVVSLYAGQWVMPRVRRLRLTAASSAGTPEHTENRSLYDRAHQLSVTLNSLVLIILIGQVLIYAYRIKPAFVENV